jgi:putative oxygen-independent coproporphyrinogen III oxidase
MQQLPVVRHQGSTAPAPPAARPEGAGVTAGAGIGRTGRTGRTAGIYVHFPYCLAKCPYCDFVSYATERSAIDHAAYANAVLAELQARRASLAGRVVSSLFFGGGTPSLWDPAQLGRVIAAVREQLECSEDLEVTVECNPTSIDEDRARALVDVGVGRVSIGVQSLRDERLKHLGRLHDADGGRRAVLAALRVVPRVSADLIFGLPGQTPEQARDEALELVGLGLCHTSCYQLTIEPGTRFGELAKRGRLPLADEGAVAESFVAIDEALGARGLEHYEVSNYAAPGQQARHNLGYWRGDEYLGLGCAAYGFVLHERGRGVRYRNEPLPDRYVKGREAVSGPPEPLDAATLMRERIMLGLRLRQGLDLAEAAEALGAEGWTEEREKACRWLVDRGRLVREGSRIRVPASEGDARAWLWTDDTAARLF